MDIDKLTAGFLQEASRRIIDLFRSKKYDALLDIYRFLFPSKASGSDEKPPRKIFLELIKLYHPDSYSFHKLNLTKRGGPDPHFDHLFYNSFFNIEWLALPPRLDPGLSRETYVYEEATQQDEYFDDEYLSEDDSSSDIFAILSSLYLGNSTSRRLEPIDLEQLEEAIDLSHNDIYDLDGLQYCINISGLNLSDNHIDNLYALSTLPYLEELDLTNNNITSVEPLASLQNLKTLYLDNNSIDDLSALLKCDSLEFVSVVNNPLTGTQTINALTARGVIVLYFT